MATAAMEPTVAKKKAEPAGEPKRYGTLIRVSDDFAQKIKDAASFEKTSIADFADAHLVKIVEKRYRDGVVQAAKRFEGKEGGE